MSHHGLMTAMRRRFSMAASSDKARRAAQRRIRGVPPDRAVNASQTPIPRMAEASASATSRGTWLCAGRFEVWIVSVLPAGICSPARQEKSATRAAVLDFAYGRELR